MSKASWVFQLDGDLRGIPRVLAEGIETRIFPGEQVMISVVRVDPGASGTIHSHPEEQWGVMLERTCTRIQAGEEIECAVGDFCRNIRRHQNGKTEHRLRKEFGYKNHLD
ncbi:MAG: cupin domain-containing protein [Betaproteobacteria bacterium]